VRVVCENCGQESLEEKMNADAMETVGDERFSNHICPFCDFWNDTRRVWMARDEGLKVIDLTLCGEI